MLCSLYNFIGFAHGAFCIENPANMTQMANILVWYGPNTPTGVFVPFIHLVLLLDIGVMRLLVVSSTNHVLIHFTNADHV